LPVVQAVKFEMILNLKTANELGLNVPPGYLPAPTGDRMRRRVHQAGRRRGSRVAACRPHSLQ
jgi:hypothetical protein